jgi:hypothetical protein
MRFRLSAPAFVLALVALFVALGGGAVAAGIVPLARHAITAGTAGNALKLDGKTSAQLTKSLRGARGPQGVPGPVGASGTTGAAGNQGATGPRGSAGAQGSQGPQGPKGDVGAGLKIVGTVATPGELPATGTTGDGYLVAGVLYVWTGSVWTNAGPVQGPKGDTGVVGPAGPAGPTGPAGAAGAAGTAAVSVHSAAYSLPASGDQTFVTSCGAGQKAVGGGYDGDGSGAVINLDLKPTAADDGWSIWLANTDTGGSHAGTVYAVCLG